MRNQPTANPLTVSQLNRSARELIESGFGRIWVEGEISNIARPASGHLYFRLKDGRAQVAAAFFRNAQRGPTIRLKDGDQVLVFAKVSLYEARGDFQLIVEEMEPAGEGLLKRQYERLKNKLADEGLFDESLKRPLPVLPARIGVITSPSGAALRDILTVLRRRFPSIPVVIYPSAVQGEAAAPELLAALETANRRAECDVLIIGRGGGSLEDLWAFNDEALARGIAASEIPVVSAVGHEVDFTIADFVADVRAPTPSGAAEMVAPDAADWLQHVERLERQLLRGQRRRLDDTAQSIDWLQRRLLTASPAARLQRQAEAVAGLARRLATTMRERQYERQQQLARLDSRLRQRSPLIALQRCEARLAALREKLLQRMTDRLADRGHRLALASRALHSVSPLATLERGYAIVLDRASGKALSDASRVEPGTEITAKLAHGSLLAKVESTSD